mmetsp:Transcript_74289/g.143881  ORF Transcript_74289/g.143881 Transcript_74289/m.143881 type:complete len:181 (+) Transcript_74289:42-584(+)
MLPSFAWTTLTVVLLSLASISQSWRDDNFRSVGPWFRNASDIGRNCTGKSIGTNCPQITVKSVQIQLKCYVKFKGKASGGDEGKCLVPHKSRCVQLIPDNPSSGGCRYATYCVRCLTNEGHNSGPSYCVETSGTGNAYKIHSACEYQGPPAKNRMAKSKVTNRGGGSRMELRMAQTKSRQ